MVKINIICIGKIKDKYIRDGISEFSKRLSRYANLNIIELPEEDDNKGIGTAITKETERIIDALNKRNRSYSILLDLKGKLKSSEEMAEEIENKIATIEAEMNENGSDFGTLSSLQRQMDEENERLLAKYERYEYLSELAEN